MAQTPPDQADPFASGGLTGAQQNIAIAVIRNAPGGLAIVANLLSKSPTCCRTARREVSVFPM